MEPSQSTWISVADAAICLKISPDTVIRRIKKGLLPARRPPEMPFTFDGKENYEVRLEALPIRIQYKYLYQHIPQDEKCSLDLVAPRSVLGNAWMNEFLDIAKIIQESSEVKQTYQGTGKVTEELRRVAEKHGISLSTLYRLIGKPTAVCWSKLYDDSFNQYVPSSMCLWSCDLAYALFLDSENHYSHNDIYEELNAKRGIVSCTDCPYNPSNAQDAAPCPKAQDCMRVPNCRRTVSRLLNRVPPQMLLYAKKGYREWRAKYGLFVKRDRPLLPNEIWQGDHHKFSVFVRIKVQQRKGNKVYEKEVAVRPTLTAWIDSATGCFVGWVISVMPNSETISEAFCRAAVLTPGVPFRGLPKAILVDCGKDYKSRLLEDTPPELCTSTPEDTFLNKRFSGLGILPALNVTCYHALPYHPQTKPIERYFGTIERKWISKLPGWCHSSIEERPPDFQKKLNKLLKNKELLTLEEFVEYFQNTLLPEYHGTIDEETTIPDLPGWELSRESMTPMQRYERLEKARTITPDWKTISILKLQFSPNHIVGRWGVRFKNTYYQADELSGIVHDRVDILYHKVQSPYAPSSITIIHNNRVICEAFPAEIRHLAEDPKTLVMCDSDRQNQPAKEMNSLLTQIRQSAHAILPDKVKSSTESIESIESRSQLYDLTYGPSVIDSEATSSPKTKDTTATDIQKSLRFLFGEEE